MTWGNVARAGVRDETLKNFLLVGHQQKGVGPIIILGKDLTGGKNDVASEGWGTVCRSGGGRSEWSKKPFFGVRWRYFGGVNSAEWVTFVAK